MRLPGYCTGCHRIKQVRVSGAQMALVAAGQVAQGTCASCEQKEEDERNERRNRHRQ